LIFYSGIEPGQLKYVLQDKLMCARICTKREKQKPCPTYQSKALIFFIYVKVHFMSEILNLTNEQAVDKLRQLAKDETCLFCTFNDMYHLIARPMITQAIDNDGCFWFLSSKESAKNDQILRSNKVQLLYGNPAKQNYLSVEGEATVLYDQNKINNLWTPIAKTWFTEGKKDPSISLIKVKPIQAYYWDTKNTKMVSFMKTLAASITGKPKDAAIEGQIVTQTKL
jgi:general stress protein 26